MRSSLRKLLLLQLAVLWFVAVMPAPIGNSANASDRGAMVVNEAPANQPQRFLRGHALVIGNSRYQYTTPLPNPANDAKDIANALKPLGFEVTLKVDATLKAMENNIKRFGRKLREGGVGLFYYAGHGVQVAGRNYLIPIDADVDSESDIKYEAIDAGRLLGKMEDANNGTNIIILDACRNNPFSSKFRGVSRGLAKMDAPAGSLIAYSTAPGSVAADGDGRNGLYTSKLLTLINREGLTIEECLKKVRVEVMKETANEQVPWESSSLTVDFYFVGPKKMEITTKEASPSNSIELLFWESVKDSEDAKLYQSYIDEFPEGSFVKLAALYIDKYTPQRPAVIKTKANGDDGQPAATGGTINRKDPGWVEGADSPQKATDPSHLEPIEKSGSDPASSKTPAISAAQSERDKQILQKAIPGPVASISPSKKAPGAMGEHGQYIKYPNGIVYDKATGLEWYSGPGRSISVSDLKKWIKHVNTDGGNWRIPTQKELMTLYEKGAGRYNISPLLEMHDPYVWYRKKGLFFGNSAFDAHNFLLNPTDPGAHHPKSSHNKAFAVRSKP
jgi:hypothetical protein